MNELYDLIIIGGGPAGLFAAITASSSHKKTLIFEKNDRAGKKFLMSGSGRCNITNAIDIDLFPQKYGEQQRFVKPVLSAFTNSDLINWFKSRGIIMKVLHDNKVFPGNESSKELLDVLLAECKKASVIIQYGEIINKITKTDDIFTITAQSGTYYTKNLLISTGGASYPSTGSTGDGYRFAKELGHTIIPAKPALTPVLIENYQFSDCSGISFENISVSIIRENKTIYKTRGDLLFTHKGLSGPVILDASRFIEKGDTITINLTRFNDAIEFEKDINTTSNIQGKKDIKNFLTLYEIPEKIILNVLSMLSIPCNTKTAELNKVCKKQITQQLTVLPCKVAQKSGFNEAMATSGGVNTSEINRKTMESKIVKGLYYAGEVVDVDGDTGGFNLQFAFSSGYTVGKAISPSPTGLV
ncbi:MAG: hypothetical protein A2015_04110 [Spirochaetes bacterium GWF1_31_7]|nr:MAG: hypothetical protein A2Y30_14645 [Spirochaetes bacterium GWE1_32_154]OHD48676.1 MAG: hypothetical protein A2015_04110 [Spirochaetes bacterium GWF1_31_7]OHD50193.1 MAG: hypothetical protein A2Y29_12690 [Spirochaetes bacterium GWE2_31_10]OHD79265.1 MAG: hypothetical protein A2355_03580 [Spirochaetes bacterium RIFOXYB1_FULL_32_8]HBD94026.1 NAD(P)/FAD-dependent oxidoreductase [Spirochaetia bacterium]